MARSPFHIRPARLEDLPGVVRCHQVAFPGQFLTRLGPDFLRDYYRFYLENPQGIDLVATDASGQVLGFVNGGEPALRGRFIRSRVPRFLRLLFRQALVDPFVRRRLRVHLRHLIGNLASRLGLARPPEPPPPAKDRTSVLLSIAVVPEATGQGIGKALMEAFRQESLRRGFRAMTLSAHRDNETAVGLYRSCGWKVIREDSDGVYLSRSTEP